MSTDQPRARLVGRAPAWLLALAPLVLAAALIGVFLAGGGPGLERSGVPVEDVSVERVALRPGEISVTVRNDGPDAVRIVQALVNDAYLPGAAGLPADVGRLGSATLRLPYPWIAGEAYEIGLVTSTGGVIPAQVDVAAETPEADASFLGLMALLGLYVGVIPVSVGMLWLPFARRARPATLRFLLAFTVGLLAFLGLDALIEGLDVAATGPQAFGGAALVLLGALAAFVLLSGVDAAVRAGRARAEGWRLATLIAVGIGLHNLGEGLAIGSAYAIGELALGAFLVVGFAIHNTTEGLAIVTPVAHEPRRLGRLLGLGVLAGAPAIAGAWLGGLAYSAPLAAVLLGAGVGAIAQVCWQLVPALRGKGSDRAPLLTPLTAGGVLTGLALMYVTGLLV